MEFARFYDQIMGDRSDDVDRVAGYIRRFRPDARSLLELGCGTGALLAALYQQGQPGELSVTGIDRSPGMLATAAASVPQATLIQADMTAFSLAERFDVAICMFDTLNHLQRFESWLELFDRVYEHLAPDGIFIFDVNTTGRMRRLWRGAGFAVGFGANTVIMEVSPIQGDLSDWEVTIFEHLGEDNYRRHHESIPELAVPLATIRDALAVHFDLLAEDDLEGGTASDDSERVYYACVRRGIGQ